jgi:hypothetical protein
MSTLTKTALILRSKISFVLLFTCLASLGWAQKAPVLFNTKTANFGKIKEQAKQVSYEFSFVNKGDDPLRIEKVVPSCGCTATEFTQLAISKDSVGKIKVTYSTINRPGEFAKTISVFFQGYETPEIITIKGIVLGTQRMYERELVFPIGNLRFQSRVISLRTVRTKEPERREFEFYNAGKKDITIKNIILDTAFLKVTFNKTTIHPNEAGRIRLTYNALKKKDWGLVVDTLWLLTNDDSIPSKPILLAAHIEEYFPLMNEAALASAPKIKFEKTDHSFGTVKEGSMVTYSFKFTNEGKQDLVIRKIVSGCSCITFELSKYTYAPGESGVISVTLNTHYREGIQNKNINVISNSPAAASINLWLRGNIVD